jgi:hypothetical protein
MCLFPSSAGVEISVDGGASFVRAALDERDGWSRQRFALRWRPTERGQAQLCARAFDATGATQPFQGARNAVHHVRIVVR